MLATHLRVNDEATGRPVPVRLRITDAAGAYLPPLGRLADFATDPGRDVGGHVRLGGRAHAFIDGTCEALLPPGTLTVEIDRGPEYTPVCREVGRTAGQLALRLGVRRWADHAAAGWFAGDARAHDLTPRAAALEGAAGGLAFVHVLARQRVGPPACVSGLLDFSGPEAALSAYGCSVAVNTLNEHPVLGTVALLESHRPVFPLRFGAPDGDGWSVADWCDQCHRKGGLVVWPDLPRLSDRHPQGEALAAALSGKIDAFELGPPDQVPPPSLADYYRLLDCGRRLCLVAGSGKDGNASALGSVRTYAHCPQAGPGGPSVREWVAAARAGRTFVTTAPLLSLSADGHGPGSALRVEKGGRVRLRAEAHSGEPFDYLELIVDGEVRATKTASGNRTSAVLETDHVCTRSSWVAATCYAPTAVPAGPCVFAHTNPIYLDVPGEPVRPTPDAADPLLAVLAATRRWVAGEGRFPDDRPRQHLFGVLDQAASALAEARRRS